MKYTYYHLTDLDLIINHQPLVQYIFTENMGTSIVIYMVKGLTFIGGSTCIVFLKVNLLLL